MRGFSFLITWLVFGIPSSAIAVGIGSEECRHSDEIHVRGLRKERKQS